VTAVDLLLVFRDATRHTGGLTVEVRNIANDMTRRGHRVRVIGMAGDEATLAPAGYLRDVELTELRSPFGATGARYGLATGVARRVAEAQVVHVFSCLPVHLHFAAMAAARAHGRALVWTPMMHPARRDIWGAYGRVGTAMRGFDAVVPRLARFVDAVYAATEAEAHDFRRLGAKRVEIVPPTVPDAPMADADGRDFRLRHGIDRGPMILTVASRRERRKGVAFGLAAFTRLHASVPDASLVLVGAADGDGELPPRARAVGRIDDRELLAAYRAADVVFVPSEYEAFSRVVIEAWQQERPVVVTDRVGVAELVRHGGGRVVQYGDADAAAIALRDLATRGPTARAQAAWGRRVVEERFVLPRVVDTAEAVYRTLALC
jgi:glycosyltransferase involved in cell wall biosynthesis